MDAVIEVNHVTASYGEAIVLDDLTFSVPRGTMMGIIGPNGAGKSTLLKVMLSLLRPLSGTVKFRLGEHLSEKEMRKKIAYVPQTNRINPDFPATVFDVALMGRYTHVGWFRRPGKADRTVAWEALERVEMSHLANRPLGDLSGGQQQRVFIARALAQQAELCLLDEPFKGIDARTEDVIVSVLQDLRREGKTIIAVHHALRTAPTYFDSMIFLHKKIIAVGAKEEVFTKENIEKTYAKEEGDHRV